VPVRPRRSARAVAWLSWLYVAGLVGMAILLWTCSDAWWPVTMLMYAPRWPLGLPLVLLVPAAILVRPRSLWALFVATAVLLWPVMGLCVPWRQVLAGEPTGPQVRVLTCNVHYQQLDPLEFRGLIGEARPDIIALQYWTSRDEAALPSTSDWHIHRQDQFLLISRYPIRATHTRGEPLCAVRYELEAPFGTIQFGNIHLETPRDGLLAVVHKRDEGIPELEANMRLRRRQSADITRWLRDVDGPLLMAGDFNTPVESEIYREFWSPYTNAFSTGGLGFGLTQFTPRRTAVRIDHQLAGPGWRCRDCWVGPFVGSEHRPVLASWEWTGAP
jgi:endonuclease/exonuclease/phosphatase (EEP) superfamily protein YafD